MRFARSSGVSEPKSCRIATSLFSASSNRRVNSEATGCVVRVLMVVFLLKAKYEYEFVFAIRVREPNDPPCSSAHRPSKIAGSRALDPAGGCHRRGGDSRSSEGGRSALHHDSGRRRGRGQRRLAVPVLPEQAGH